MHSILTKKLIVRRLLKAALAVRSRINFDPPSQLAEEVVNIASLQSEHTVTVIGPRGRKRIVVHNPALEGFIIAPDGSACADGILDEGLKISILQPDRWWSPATFSQDAVFRITRPVIKLLALCHREYFPIPRFALGISDLASTIRSGFFGQVSLMDMQVGDTIPSMVKECIKDSVDIVGVSVTFGQHDLLKDLLSLLISSRLNILVVVGGSLAALNSVAILRHYPQVLIARSAGEITLRDIVNYWRGECPVHSINDIEFVQACPDDVSAMTAQLGAQDHRHLLMPTFGNKVSSETPDLSRTAKSNEAQQDVPLPELDLLPRTLYSHGVMQLETCRGCNFACSFCPREHKGAWYAADVTGYDSFLSDVGAVYDAYPAISRKIFLVDEEFFGDRHDAENRVLHVATVMHRAGFHFETSSRLDQVYRPCENVKWHTRRLRVWQQLVKLGMDRCLFGVESGVDSILARFRKRTTSEQNAIAIRLLSLVYIPVRLTYITFDPLMTMRELIETYRFQGRTDLCLAPTPNEDLTKLLATALDDSVAMGRSIGVPLYERISYMLVSLECLLGSDYLYEVNSAGLTGTENLLMGRRDTQYADPIIGTLSQHAQMWIDRSFTLDYILKSLLKITMGPTQSRLVSLRKTLKDYAYRLLGIMLVIANNDASLEACEGDGREAIKIASHSGWGVDASPKCLSAALQSVMTWLFDTLVHTLESMFIDHAGYFGPRIYRLIEIQLARWRHSASWTLING